MLLGTTRALMFTSGLPMRFWPYFVLTATWIPNRIPSRVLDWNAPFEIMFKEEPDSLCLDLLATWHVMWILHLNEVNLIEKY